MYIQAVWALHFWRQISHKILVLLYTPFKHNKNKTEKIEVLLQNYLVFNISFSINLSVQLLFPNRHVWNNVRIGAIVIYTS